MPHFHPIFVSERIAPEPGYFDIAAMARGEPAVPRAFVWRGQRYDVAQTRAAKRTLGSDRGDTYLRRHYFDVETTDALRMSLYFERNPSDRSKPKAWWLYTYTHPEPEIETPRLLLRRWTYADRDAFARMTQDPDVMRYMHDSVPLSDREVDAALASTIERYEQLGFGDWALVERETNEILGESGLGKLEGRTDIEIGWMLLPRHWGKGYAFEAASAVKEHARSVIGLRHLVALTRPDNARSIDLAGRLGLREAGRLVHLGHEMLKFEVDLAGTPV
ncbi:MAG TPA: GNAT family N-acetyltransferase [Candidatus Acidoferrales bacterium]|nr:GNAT family N-acetyltransferase [Candidatus Acidoferrales bacterium]